MCGEGLKPESSLGNVFHQENKILKKILKATPFVPGGIISQIFFISIFQRHKFVQLTQNLKKFDERVRNIEFCELFIDLFN